MPNQNSTPGSLATTESVAPKTGSASAAPTGGTAPTPAGARPRLASIDLLRGAVMILMVLDHARDFFNASAMSPRDVTQPALFLTRWVTNFCAPVFVFLAGVSAFLYLNRGRTKHETSWFLLTRGLWLVVIELTVVRIGWSFNPQFEVLVLQVIWVIGVAMIVLSGLVFLPRWTLATFAVVLIAGHNLLDGVKPEAFGTGAWVWTLIHGSVSMLQLSPDTNVLVIYAIVPWIGVLAAGYAFGPTFLLPEASRHRTMWTLGLGLVAVFVVLRATNLYGDPARWAPQATPLASVLAFINCEKYPASLLYLAMTLGPAITVMPWLEKARGYWAEKIVTIGRVPLLFYVSHIYVLHVVAVVYSAASIGDAAWLFTGAGPLEKPAGYGLSLPLVYAVWLAVVVALYFPCRWFAALKQRRKDAWLSYL